MGGPGFFVLIQDRNLESSIKNREGGAMDCTAFFPFALQTVVRLT